MLRFCLYFSSGEEGKGGEEWVSWDGGAEGGCGNVGVKVEEVGWKGGRMNEAE